MRDLKGLRSLRKPWGWGLKGLRNLVHRGFRDLRGPRDLKVFGGLRNFRAGLAWPWGWRPCPPKLAAPAAVALHPKAVALHPEAVALHPKAGGGRPWVCAWGPAPKSWGT